MAGSTACTCGSEPPDEEPPERTVPGPLKWDLTDGIATDTPESLRNSGMDPAVESTHGRAFAEDLPTRDLNPSETKVLAVAIKPEPGRTFCSTWDVTDHEGRPITVGFVARIMLESDDGGPEHMVCRAMNWRSARDESTNVPDDLAQRILNGMAQPGVHRALVDIGSWTLLKWLDEPCPFYDWRSRDGESPVHPDDDAQIEAMTEEFATRSIAGVVRLHAIGGGWTPIHITVHRVELDSGVFAGLLSVRLPTDEELADHEERTKPRRGARISKSLRDKAARA